MEKRLFTGPGREKYRMSLKGLTSESEETIRNFEINVKDTGPNFKGRLKCIESIKIHQLIMILKEGGKNTRVHTQQLIGYPQTSGWRTVSKIMYFNPEFQQRWETSPFTLWRCPKPNVKT